MDVVTYLWNLYSDSAEIFEWTHKVLPSACQHTLHSNLKEKTIFSPTTGTSKSTVGYKTIAFITLSFTDLMMWLANSVQQAQQAISAFCRPFLATDE